MNFFWGGLLSFLLAADSLSKSYAPEGYSIKTIQTPEDVRFHITGLKIDSDDSVVCATRYGDIWRYKNQQWQLIADGLHEPTGLLIDDDGSILIGQKPELTRLVDSNNDGVMDQYIRVADGWDLHDNYHEFNFGPVKDKQGNLFATLNLAHGGSEFFKYNGKGMGSGGGYRGWAYRVTKEGQFEPYAFGLRSPAGIGASPNGEIFFTDNQGDWVGTSKIHMIRKNEFYGHPSSLPDLPQFTQADVQAMSVADIGKIRTIPNVWIPHREVANSPGNPVWETTGNFGPFKGQVFIGDQTKSNIFRVLLDKVKGEYQGAVINFMDGFQSGNIRLAFAPGGELWVGQTARGWSAKGGKPFGLQKVVYDGHNKPFELLNIKLTKKGFDLTFTNKIDRTSVNPKSFKVEKWHYHYHPNYGSPKVDTQSVTLSKVKLSRNKRTIRLELPLETGKVFGITFSGIKAKDQKKPSTNKVYYTLNYLR